MSIANIIIPGLAEINLPSHSCLLRTIPENIGWRIGKV